MATSLCTIPDEEGYVEALEEAQLGWPPPFCRLLWWPRSLSYH